MSPASPKPSPEPGPELDAMLAEAMGRPLLILGVAPCARCGSRTTLGTNRAWCHVCAEWQYSPYPEFSTDPAATIQAAEEMREKGRIGRWNLHVGPEGATGQCVRSPKAALPAFGKSDKPAHALTLALLEALHE